MNAQSTYDVVAHSTLDRRNTVDASLAGYVGDVLAGKASTADFFNGFNGLHNVMKTIANNSSTWQSGHDKDLNPVYWLIVGDYRVVVKSKKYQANFFDDTQKPRAATDDLQKFKWNGKDYTIAALTECSISNDKSHFFFNSAHVGMSIEHWGKFALDIGFAGIMKTILTNACRRLIQGFAQIAGANVAVGANAMANGAAEGALVEEEVSVFSTTACYVGLAVIAVGVTLALMEHDTYHNLKLYNLTTSNVKWSLIFLHDGTEISSQPSNDGINPVYELMGGTVPWTPEGVEPDSKDFVYSEGNFQFKNGHSFRGIYYVITMEIKGAASGAGNASFLFDIPFSGDNSIFASFDALSDKKAAEDYYKDHAATHKQFRFQAGDAKYKLTLTYDYLSGEHLMPLMTPPKKKYYYQSLAVRDGLIPAPQATAGGLSECSSQGADGAIGARTGSSNALHGWSFSMLLRGTPIGVEVPRSASSSAGRCAVREAARVAWAERRPARCDDSMKNNEPCSRGFRPREPSFPTVADPLDRDAVLGGHWISS